MGSRPVQPVLMRTPVAFLPLLALAPLIPWLGARAVDGGALSASCLFGGLALVIAGALRQRSQSASQSAGVTPLLVLAGGGVLVGVAIALSSRALVVGGAAFLSAGASTLCGARARVVVPGAALLALGAVHPADVDALVGWPLRALLAQGAAHLLAPFAASASAPIAAETVLLIEGRVADVESACAGTRSLTAFALCFAVVFSARALTTARTTAPAPAPAHAHAHVHAPLLAFGVGVFVLLAFSVVRVAAIAGLALVADSPSLAELVHAPLGLFALLAGSASAIAVLELHLNMSAGDGRSPHHRSLSARCAIVLSVSAAALVVVAVAQVCAPSKESRGSALAGFAGFAGLGAGDMPLSDHENALFTQLGAVAVKRVWPRSGRDGSVLLVAGPRRAHHAPERCLAAMGLHVDAATTVLVSQLPVRRLILSNGARGDQREQYVGTSFFVSRDRVVASALERGMRDAVLGEGPWIFVSILHRDDGLASAPQEAAGVRALVDEARAALAAHAHAHTHARGGTW